MGDNNILTKFKKTVRTAASIATEKVIMGVFIIASTIAVTAVDLFAFENGAVATISQVWLTINKRFWFLTYILAILVGILLQHVSVPRDLAHGVNPGFIKQALLWTPAFWVGLYI